MSDDLQIKKYDCRPRWQKNKDRKIRQKAEKMRNLLRPCDSCNGMMSWCSCCEVFTKTCCVDWGTCMCS